MKAREMPRAAAPATVERKAKLNRFPVKRPSSHAWPEAEVGPRQSACPRECPGRKTSKCGEKPYAPQAAGRCVLQGGPLASDKAARPPLACAVLLWFCSRLRGGPNGGEASRRGRCGHKSTAQRNLLLIPGHHCTALTLTHVHRVHLRSVHSGRIDPRRTKRPSKGDVLMRETFANIAVSVATNTALFTGLDLGQWISDKFSLWSLPSNLIAAVIATVFGLALTAAMRFLRREESDVA